MLLDLSFVFLPYFALFFIDLFYAKGSLAFDDLCLESGFGVLGQDIDECSTLSGLCENGRCVNTLGSYRFEARE